MTFFYVLLAFVIGLLVGWFLWGRRRRELEDMRNSLDRVRRDNDKLKADATRLNDELAACGSARADLERQLQEAKAAQSSVAPVNVVAFPSAPDAPQVPSTGAPAKSGNVKAAKAPAAKAKTASAAGKDNLRRLIGIGPVNERRLNEHGITTFAQIAAWTAADIKRIEEYLQFDGRIKREQWVRQAKLLAAGNEKEFARRFPSAGGSGNT